MNINLKQTNFAGILSALTDVNVSGPSDQDALIWDNGISKWIAQAIDHDALTNFSASEHFILGETSTTAYRGDRGKSAYDHIHNLTSDINHDALTNFLGNKHIDHTGVTLTAGTGLTGGGTIAASRTFDVDVGITNNKIVKINHASVADDDFAKFTASGLEGRSYSEVRADLGLVIGTNIQAYDAGLLNLAGVAMAANKFYYTSGDNTHVAATVTSFARSILDDANEATFKATVNLEIGTDVLAERTIGVADTNLVRVDGSASDNLYARFTASGLEGRTYTDLIGDLSGQSNAAFSWNSQSLASINNLGVGVSAWGDDAVKVLGMGNATAPTTSPANMTQLWSENRSAARSQLYYRAEGGEPHPLDTRYNVMDYGAKGDGSTDDSTAIQAAITAGRHVYFPEPSVSYKIDTGLTIPGHSWNLVGENNQVQIIYTGAGSAINNGTGGKIEYTRIRNLTFSHDGADETAIAINMQDFLYSIIEGVRIIKEGGAADWARGIYLNCVNYGCYWNAIRDTIIYNCTAGLEFGAGANNANANFMNGGLIHSCTTGVKIGSPSESNLIDDLDIESCTTGIDDDGTTTKIGRVRFESNTVDITHGSSAVYPFLSPHISMDSLHVDSVARETETLNNLLINGSFEIWNAGTSATLPTNWSGDAAACSRAWTVPFPNMGAVLKIIRSGGVDKEVTQDFTCISGQCYTIVAWRRSSGDPTARITVAGNVSGDNTITYADYGQTAWKKIVAEFAAGASDTTMTIKLRAISSNGDVYFDRVAVYEGYMADASYNPHPVDYLLDTSREPYFAKVGIGKIAVAALDIDTALAPIVFRRSGAGGGGEINADAIMAGSNCDIQYIPKPDSTGKGGHVFYADDGSTVDPVMGIDYLGNIGFGTTTFGTNMAGGFAMKNATPPTGNVTDCFQIYSADQAGGNACFHTRAEGGAVIKLYRQAHIPNAGDPAEVQTRLNLLFSYLENLGLLATS